MRALTFAQHEQHRALYVATLAQGALGLCDDIPGSSNPKAGSPNDVGHVRPYGPGLVRKHDDLDAVVRHALGHAPVGGHHTAAEVLPLAFDGERAAAIPDPV